VATVGVSAAAWAAVIGVPFAVWQLWLTRRAHVSGFEMRFVDRYESLLARLPDDVVMERRELSNPSIGELRVFHDYFALCDEEVFYRREGKVSAATWRDWERGMQLNLQRPTFQVAWRALRAEERLDKRFADFEPLYEKLFAQRHFDPKVTALRRWWLRTRGSSSN
jgi:hypothetical protein